MANHIQAASVLQYVSTDDGATFKTIVCLTENGWSGTKSSSTVDTKCGSLTATGSTDITFTGTGVADTDPETTELSINDFKNLFSSGAEFILIEKSTDETYFAGGAGVLTDFSVTNSQGNYTTFSYTFKVNGPLFINEASI